MKSELNKRDIKTTYVKARKQETLNVAKETENQTRTFKQNLTS